MSWWLSKPDLLGGSGRQDPFCWLVAWIYIVCGVLTIAAAAVMWWLEGDPAIAAAAPFWFAAAGFMRFLGSLSL